MLRIFNNKLFKKILLSTYFIYIILYLDEELGYSAINVFVICTNLSSQINCTENPTVIFEQMLVVSELTKAIFSKALLYK